MDGGVGEERTSILKKNGGNTERISGSRSPRRDNSEFSTSSANPSQRQAWPLPLPLSSDVDASMTAVSTGFVVERKREDPLSWTGSAPLSKKARSEEIASGSVDPPPGIPVIPGNQHDEKSEELNLSDVMNEIKNLSLDMKTQFTSVESYMHEFRAELAQLKSEMVSRHMFDQLESRVTALENQGVVHPDMSFLRQQVNRLDPAHRSVRVRGFKQTDTKERKKSIDQILHDLGMSASRIEHIYKGPKGSRSLADMCIMEFTSHDDREHVLKEFDKRDKSQDLIIGKLEVDRAKPQMQLKRNAALRDAEKVLKKDSKNQNQKIEIVWRKADAKDKVREVTVNGKAAFTQSPDDMIGNFLVPFTDLKI